MAQHSTSESSGAGSNQDLPPPVIPIKLPHELWQRQQPNGGATSVIATLDGTPTEIASTRVFFSESNLGRSCVSQSPSGHQMLFQHFRNFDSRQDVLNHLNAMGRLEPDSTLEYHGASRLLPLHALAAFTERHPNLKYILYAIFVAEVTIPPNTDRVSLLPARADESTGLMVHWLCEVDDDGMNAELSNFVGLSPEVIGPEASLPFDIRPFNVYVASAVHI
ncbi:hypothetical protein OCU04_011747 [Sclerotinia nivalis]|uniref:Uncharacterized protein n=1 Tax=Sclerotinia nivalis TaxID=352851 RepID=A0A9X0DFD4_9HELO|nr:hypothetical protein OCU04_011747 [Sclerotinia nivalis]